MDVAVAEDAVTTPPPLPGRSRRVATGDVGILVTPSSSTVERSSSGRSLYSSREHETVYIKCNVPSSHLDNNIIANHKVITLHNTLPLEPCFGASGAVHKNTLRIACKNKS